MAPSETWLTESDCDAATMLDQGLPAFNVENTANVVAKELQERATMDNASCGNGSLQEIGASFSVEQLAEARADGQSGCKRHPSSETEHKIREVWARVFGMVPNMTGLDDNFFHLGGDSIVAMKAVGQARELDIQVTVADFFRHPSLHDLAKHCHQILDSSPEPFWPPR